MDSQLISDFSFTISTLISRANLQDEKNNPDTLSGLLQTLLTKYRKLMGILNPEEEDAHNVPLITAEQKIINLNANLERIERLISIYLSMLKSISGISTDDEKTLIKFLRLLANNPTTIPKEKDYLWK